MRASSGMSCSVHDRRRQDEEQASERADGCDPERRPQADRRAEHAADAGAQRADAVVHDHERARDARAEVGRDQPALIVPAMMSSSIRPKPERNSAANRHAITSQCGPPAIGTRIERRGEEEAAESERRPDADPAARSVPSRTSRRASRSRRRRARARASPGPRRAARRVEHEQREEDEVEEVQRRDAEQLGADDRVVADPACAGESTRPISCGAPAARRCACARGRAPTRETRRASTRERVRPAQQLHEHAADAVAGEERERAAPVHERVRLRRSPRAGRASGCIAP